MIERSSVKEEVNNNAHKRTGGSLNIKQITLALITLMAMNGCTTINIIFGGTDSGTRPMTMGDAGVPMGDAGMYVADDAAPLPTPDASSDSGTDAAVVAPPALTVVFDGPAESDVLRGTQDNVMYRFTLTARVDIEIRFLDFNIEGVTSSDRVRGSAGTDLFRDIKLKDLDTGVTVMGPVGPDTTRFTDSFVMHAGETRRLGLTMDISNHEDAPGEFFDGTHSYRVTVGAEGTFFEASAVREVATGVFFGRESIENDVVIAGNAQTVVDAALLVNMAATPAHTLAVRKERNVPSVGIVFTASAADDIMIRSVRLSGVGNVDATDGASDLNDIVTACALFDGAIQVGLAQTPDATTGQMHITGVNLLVPAGTSRTLEARCTADSVVEGDEDRYSIGIAAASDIDSVRTDLLAIVASVSVSLQNNAFVSTGNYVRVIPRGVLTIATSSLRQSTILVAGGDVWQNFAQYQATAQYEGMDIDAVRVTSGGDAASFTQVAVAMDGVVLGTCILPAGANRSCEARLSSPIRVGRDSSRTFQLWGKLADVLSSTAVAPGTPRCVGYPCSGARLHLGIEAGVTTGDWDPSYSASLNVRTTGTISGDRIFYASPTLLGNEFVVRRSKPTFTRQSLSTTTLSNGTDADLYRFQVSADSAGSVAIMGFRFRMSMTGSGTVSSLRIRSGSTDMSGVTITYDGTYVVVIFDSEVTITGSGRTFTLHGVTNGFVAGDTVSTSPFRDPVGTLVTGYVGPDSTLAGIIGGVPAGILWSDMSEIPHSSASMSAGGSMDWTNETYVEDMTQTQVLSR
jgi:hypothetical protein